MNRAMNEVKWKCGLAAACGVRLAPDTRADRTAENGNGSACLRTFAYRGSSYANDWSPLVPGFIILASLHMPEIRIDAHHHLWRYNAEEYGWMTDNMAAIRRDFLPDDLCRTMQPAGIKGAVTVQAESDHAGGSSCRRY